MVLLIPEHIKVEFSLEPSLLKLLQDVVDQRSDRAAAAALSTAVKAKTGALAAALQPSKP